MVLWPVWLVTRDLAVGSKRLNLRRIPGRSKRRRVYGSIYLISNWSLNHDRNENTAECKMMDPKQASTMRSGWALGWLRQKWIPQALVPMVEVQKFGAQTSYRPLKAGTTCFGAMHNLKVMIQSLKKLK